MIFDFENFDWAGAAAVGGVAVTALTALSGGLAGWGRVRRLERLAALAKELETGSKQRLVLDAIVLDQAQRMDFRQRGPSQVRRTTLFWLSQVLGWAVLVGAYVGLVITLQPLTVLDSGATFPLRAAAILAVAVAFAVFLLVSGQQVRAGSLKDRADWVSKNTPSPAAPGRQDAPAQPHQADAPTQPAATNTAQG